MIALGHNNAKLEDFVKHWLRRDTTMLAYEGFIEPIPDEVFWKRSSLNLVVPPIIIRLPNRPKKQRKNLVEKSLDLHRLKRKLEPSKYSKCGKICHNIRKFKDVPTAEKMGLPDI